MSLLNNRSSAPGSIGELEALLDAAHQHRGNVQGWQTNPSTGYLELNSSAGDQLPNMFLVAKHGKHHALKHALERLTLDSQSGYPPSPVDAIHIWNLLDPGGAMR